MNNWLTVVYKVGPVQMAMLKDRFEEEGIAYFIKDESSVYPIDLYGGTEIQVRENNIKRAEEIFKETECFSGAPMEEKPRLYQDNKGKNVCPYCGSDDIHLETIYRRFVVLLLARSPSVRKRKYHCFNCNSDF